MKSDTISYIFVCVYNMLFTCSVCAHSSSKCKWSFFIKFCVCVCSITILYLNMMPHTFTEEKNKLCPNHASFLFYISTLFLRCSLICPSTHSHLYIRYHLQPSLFFLLRPPMFVCVCVCPFRFNCLNIKNVFHFVPFRIINTLERLLHQQHTNKNVLGYANEWQTKDRITKELRAEIQWNGAWVVGGRGKKESKEIKIREEISNSSNSRSSNSNKSDICMLRPFGMRSFHIIYMYCVYIYYMHPFDPYVRLLLDKMTEQRPSNKSMI